MKSFVVASFLVCFGFVSSSYSQTSDVEVEVETKKLYQEILTSLPGKFQEYIQGAEVQISSSKLSEIPLDVCPANYNHRIIFGLFRKNHVIVNSELIKLYLKNGNLTINCPHPTLKKLIQATIIHELAHVYDLNGRYANMDEYASISFFEKKYYLDTSDNKDIAEDIIYTNSKNIKHSSSPDTYEFKNIRESFAVNLEHYFLDKTYTCRRPTKAHFFNKIFNIKIESNCETSYLVQFIDLDSIKSIDINPDNVKKISYLLAGKGGSVESKFGHAQVLLDICEDQSCKKTQRYVFGFVADTPMDNYSLIGGVTGEYKSKIHIDTFLQTRLTYNVVELRDITEFPLNFSKDQKERFLGLLISSFWEYNGEYKFISNNCATELFQIFKYAVNDKEFYKKSSSTPTSIVDLLNSQNLIDKKNIKTYFGDKVLSEKLMEMNISIGPKSFISLDPIERKAYFDRITNSLDVFTFLLAENLSHQYWNKKINEHILKSADKNSELGIKIKKIHTLLNSQLMGSRSYGLPIYEETTVEKNEERMNSINKEINNEIREINKMVKLLDLDISNALENIKVNKYLLNKKLL